MVAAERAFGAGDEAVGALATLVVNCDGGANAAAAVVVGYRLLRLDRFAMPVRLLLTGAAPLLVTWGVLDLMSSATPRGGSLLAALVFSAPAVRWAVFAIVLEIAHGGATRATRAALRGQRED